MWWQIILIILGVVFLVWAVAQVTGFETRLLTRRTTRRAEDLYGNYADTKPPRHLQARSGDDADR